MTPANPLELTRIVRAGSEALIDGDDFENAVAELLAIVSDYMEDSGAYEHYELDGSYETYSMVSTEDGDPRPDWAVVLKIARLAVTP